MASAPPIDLIHLTPKRVPWDSLLLDPNNPRLALAGGHEYVPDEAADSDAVQAEMLSRLKDIGLQDITDKMRTLGFVSIDRIVVRRLSGSTDKYVILEGNRRIAALRTLRSNPVTYASLRAEVRDSLDEIEVLLYEGEDSEIAWVIQGFRHIESIKEWGPYQQARYLVDLQERKDLPVTEVAALAGIGRTRVSRLIRSYHGWQQARENEDFGDRVEERDFSIFNEAVFHQNESPLWLWLQWDDKARTFANSEPLGKLLGLVKGVDSEAARIQRVNPDLRDKFARLVVPGNEARLQEFVDGSDLDTVVQSLQHEETKKQDQEERVDLPAQLQRLATMRDDLHLLPLPKIIGSAEHGSFLARLGEITDAATTQRELLSVKLEGATEDGVSE